LARQVPIGSDSRRSTTSKTGATGTHRQPSAAIGAEMPFSLLIPDYFPHLAAPNPANNRQTAPNRTRKFFLPLSAPGLRFSEGYGSLWKGTVGYGRFLSKFRVRRVGVQTAPSFLLSPPASQAKSSQINFDQGKSSQIKAEIFCNSAFSFLLSPVSCLQLADAHSQ